MGFEQKDFGGKFQMIVYRTTNQINGKIYIGYDTQNRPNYLGAGVLIKKAIKKYGKENFTKEIIEQCGTKEELYEREKYWVEKCNSKNLEVGYNLKEGGCHSPIGRTSPEEIRVKQIKALKEHYKEFGHHMTGKKLPESWKDNISLSLKGKNIGDKNGMFGKSTWMKRKHHTEESIQCNSEKHKTLWADSNSKYNSQNISNKKSESVKTLWRNPEYRLRQIEGRKSEKYIKDRVRKMIETKEKKEKCVVY